MNSPGKHEYSPDPGLAAEVVRDIETALGQKDQIMVALDGRCASGKTTLALRLAAEHGFALVPMDHFFLRPDQRTPQRLAEPGGNVDWERVLEEVLEPLSQGRSATYRPYHCQTDDFGSIVTVEPRRVVLVEGAYSCHPALWDRYDRRYFLTVDPQEQLSRIRRRNGDEAVLSFQQRWIPLEEDYFHALDIPGRCHRCLKI